MTPASEPPVPTGPSAETVPFVAVRPRPPEAEPSQALPIGFRLDEFEVQAHLGEGGFGIVYRAWDHSLGQPRAIKEYMPSSMARREGSQVRARTPRIQETFDKGLQRFIEEAQTLARFDHPAMVRVLRRWEANGTAYMAMPLYEGPTLRERVRQMPEPPNEAWLMNVLAPLTEALAVVHQHRWLHRDIAPDNILMIKDGNRPLLLDFGAARQVIGDVTQELTAILKPGYAPVEQYGETPGLEQGPWTDIYALAATVHWAILGRTPPPSVSRVLVDNQKPLTETAQGRYSERFLAAIDKALRVDARQRTQSVAEFRADLGLDEMAFIATQVTVTAAGTAWAPTAHAATRAVDMAATEHMARPSQADAATQKLPTAITPRDDLPTQVLLTPAAPQEDDERTRVLTPPAAPPQPEESFKTEPVGRPVAQLLAMPAPRAPMPPVPAPAKSRAGLWGGLGALALLGAGGAYWLLGSGAPPAAPAEPLAQAPVTAPAPPPPVRFELDAALTALVAGGNPQRQVAVSGQPAQISIAKQEQLSFTVQVPQDGFLTVLVRGPDGSLTQLLADRPPLAVKAGQRVNLPPAGSDRLQAAEPAGLEEVLVLLSAVPRDFSALAAERQGSFQALNTGDGATSQLRTWTRKTPLLAGAPGPCEGTACDDYGVTRFTVNVLP
ncbi:MAG: serine/threonine-protein kinase [Burkholderiales bacterium]